MSGRIPALWTAFRNPGMLSRMITFPQLLRQTTAHCNRRGRQLSIAVLAFGTVSIVLWILAVRIGMAESMAQLQTILGPEATARIQAQIGTIGSQQDLEQIGMTISSEIAQKVKSLPPEKQDEMMWTMTAQAFMGAFSRILPILIFMSLFWIFSRAFFLMLGAAKGEEDFLPMVMSTLRILPRLIGVRLLTACLLFLWIPVVSFAVLFVFPAGVLVVMIAGMIFAIVAGPRLVFAPVILIQDHVGIRESFRRSFRISAGQWKRVVLNTIGVGAVVWLGTGVCQIVVNLFIKITLPFSPYALLLGQMMTFVTFMGVAYSTAFTVRLKEAVAGKQ